MIKDVLLQLQQIERLNQNLNLLDIVTRRLVLIILLFFNSQSKEIYNTKVSKFTNNRYKSSTQNETAVESQVSENNEILTPSQSNSFCSAALPSANGEKTSKHKISKIIINKVSKSTRKKKAKLARSLIAQCGDQHNAVKLNDLGMNNTEDI